MGLYQIPGGQAGCRQQRAGDANAQASAGEIYYQAMRIRHQIRLWQGRNATMLGPAFPIIAGPHSLYQPLLAQCLCGQDRMAGAGDLMRRSDNDQFIRTQPFCPLPHMGLGSKTHFHIR